MSLGPDAALASSSSAYVANNLPVNSTVLQYDIASGGGLTPKTPASAPAGADADGVAVTPDGKHAYAINFTSGDVDQYDISAAGQLSPKTPASVAAGTNPEAIAVSPDGKWLAIVAIPKP